MKEYRSLLQFGTFYRLRSPFETDQCAWIVVSKDRSKAIFGFYCMRSNVNALPGFLKLAGLDPDRQYTLNGSAYYGDELMNMGVTLSGLDSVGLVTGNDHVSFVEILEAL